MNEVNQYDNQLKYTPIKQHWLGAALAVTTNHILAYRVNRSSDYFEQFLYAPFSCLINYYMLRYGNRHQDQHDDWTNNCFLLIFKTLDKWDGKRNAYSYFGTIIKHEVLQRQNKLFTKMRDIRKEVHLDGLEHDHRESILDNISIDTTDNDYTPNDLDIKKLNEYYDTTHKGGRRSAYYNFLVGVIEGKIKIPEIKDKSERLEWMSKAAHFTSKRAFIMTQTQFKGGFNKFLYKKYKIPYIKTYTYTSKEKKRLHLRYLRDKENIKKKTRTYYYKNIKKIRKRNLEYYYRNKLKK
jgi:hypothetical protein